MCLFSCATISPRSSSLPSLHADVRFYWRKDFWDRCNERGSIVSKKRTTLLFLGSLDTVISDRLVRKPLLIFLAEDDAKFFTLRARAHPSKEEERLHVPSILRLQAASPINADIGVHYTTSPSYANYEPP